MDELRHFNSTVVQLEDPQQIAYMTPPHHFNSTVVQLEENKNMKTYIIYGFQFYCSPIRRLGRLAASGANGAFQFYCSPIRSDACVIFPPRNLISILL